MSKRKDDVITRYLAHKWGSMLEETVNAVLPTVKRVEKMSGINFTEESYRALFISCMIETCRANNFNLHAALQEEAARVCGSYEQKDIVHAIETVEIMVGLNSGVVTDSDNAKWMVLEQLSQMNTGELFDGK